MVGEALALDGGTCVNALFQHQVDAGAGRPGARPQRFFQTAAELFGKSGIHLDSAAQQLQSEECWVVFLFQVRVPPFCRAYFFSAFSPAFSTILLNS